jgi:glycosyltransferase involved in cell wall biosynthesis
MHDVTVSVWNRFHSFPLINGLTVAGFDVLGLGTTRRRPPSKEYLCCWSSAFLTQASYHLPTFRAALTTRALHRYENFAAKHALEARFFWGWSNHHLEAFRNAKSRGISVILETGSAHALWQQHVVAAEYKRQGLDFSSYYDSRVAERCVKEYEIADRICVPSQFVASTFREQGVPPEKLAVNPFGTDIVFWREALDAKKERTYPCVFIYVAQIMLRKGIAYLLKASQQLKQNDHELWLVGGVDPDSRSLLEGLPDNIKLLGRKNHFEIRDLYKRANVYVLPSLEEGMARSLLEAMAAGLPVIATQETGITDVMVDRMDGWIVPSRNAGAIAVAMQEAIENPEMIRQRGQSSAQRAAAYTWEAYGERGASFFRDFIRDRR